MKFVGRENTICTRFLVQLKKKITEAITSAPQMTRVTKTAAR